VAPATSTRSGAAGGTDRRGRSAPRDRAADNDNIDHEEASMSDITMPLDRRLLTAEEVAELLRLPA
jgi:hypothetical protein